ncbi:MAG: hypothetical protein RLZZ455_389, partial [Candidatus Parcubacteria bacterium]
MMIIFQSKRFLRIDSIENIIAYFIRLKLSVLLRSCYDEYGHEVRRVQSDWVEEVKNMSDNKGISKAGVGLLGMLVGV